MSVAIERFPVHARGGFDCRNDNANCPVCKGEHKDDHGISGGVALFAVGAEFEGKRYAVSFELLTSKFPPSVPPSVVDGHDLRDDPPRGGGLYLHVESAHGERDGCEWLHGKRCESEVIGFIAGGELYKRHGNQDPKADPADQSEDFWRALSAHLEYQLEQVRRLA